MTGVQTCALPISYATSTTAYGTLAATATGNALISGGTGTAPSWGKIGLTTHVTGTLPVANGGTGATTATVAGGVVYGSSTTAMASTAAGTAGQVLISNGASAPTWSSNIGGTATTATNLAGGSAGTVPYQSAAGTTAQLAAGTSGYILKSNGAAAPSWLQTLPVANGGTGATTAAAALTNLLPSQGGNSGDVLTTDGTSATWQAPAAVTLDYVLIRSNMIANLTGASIDIVWHSTLRTIRGEITIDANNTYFTLKAGKTYELEAALGMANASIVSLQPYYSWKDNNGVAVGSVNIPAFSSTVTSINQNIPQPIAKAVFTPSVDTQVKLVCTGIGSATIGLMNNNSYASIRQLP